ncbi:hypothetical protein [Streptomyces sodiiphilus]|uniref:hypothetical protein n=1 Tax=Streptomyces sodiiphilus TaxID=226217 RepID=UPI0031DC9A77
MSVEQLAQWAQTATEKRFEVNWATVAEGLGVMPPPDYRKMIEVFGGGSFDRHIWIHAPRSNGDLYDLTSGAIEREEGLRILWKSGEDTPSWFESETDRLIAWASTGDGEYLYWWARGKELDSAVWPMAIQNIDGEWEVFQARSIEFLMLWLLGKSDTNLISRKFAEFGNSFITYGGSVLASAHQRP